MSGHPLERFADELKVFGAKRVGELAASEADVWVGGIVSGLRPLKTKKGDRMCVFMLDDIAGSLEVVVFPETFGKHGSLVEADAMLLVRGKFEKDDESARIVATELQPIAALKERTTREVVIHLSGRPHGRTTFEALAELFIASPRRPPRLPRARCEEPGDAAARPVGRRPASAAVRAAGHRGRTDLRRRFGRVEMRNADAERTSHWQDP